MMSAVRLGNCSNAITPAEMEIERHHILEPLSDDLNFQPRLVEGVPRRSVLDSEATLEQVRETLDQTRHDLIRAQRRLERSEKHTQSLSRQLAALWVLVIVAITGLGLVMAYQLFLAK